MNKVVSCAYCSQLESSCTLQTLIMIYSSTPYGPKNEIAATLTL